MVRGRPRGRTRAFFERYATFRVFCGRIKKDMIFGDIHIHDAAEIVIDQRLLMQRHCNTPYEAANNLAAGCRRGFLSLRRQWSE